MYGPEWIVNKRPRVVTPEDGEIQARMNKLSTEEYLLFCHSGCNERWPSPLGNFPPRLIVLMKDYRGPNYLLTPAVRTKISSLQHNACPNPPYNPEPAKYYSPTLPKNPTPDQVSMVVARTKGTESNAAQTLRTKAQCVRLGGERLLLSQTTHL